MGIPHKGSRLFTTVINGKTKKFWYLVKETTTRDHDDQKELTVTIQEDNKKPGRVLQFRAPYGFGMSGRYIDAAIKLALKSGWDPSGKKQLSLDIEDILSSM